MDDTTGRFRPAEPTLIVAVSAALMTVGVVMVGSASSSLDGSMFRTHFWQSSFGRQVVFVILGFATIVTMSWAGRRMLAWPQRTWQWLALIGIAGTAGLLVAVLIPGIGRQVNGAWRWIQIGPPEYGIRFQPSEVAKLTLVIALAAWLARPAEKVRTLLGGLVPGAVIIGLLAGLVGLEDFGTAVLLAGVGVVMLWAGGCRVWHLLLLAAPAVWAGNYLIQSKPYRLDRWLSFLDIWADPQGAGYHPIQSLVTIASGGWFGRGLGNGIQKHGYLPESRTDFIFSVLCEETGVVGGVAVILLFIVLLWLGARVVRAAPNPFIRMLALGITVSVGLQAIMNIAVVTVCAPTKGIALPLVSAGGSGIVFLGIGIGFLAAAADGRGRPEAGPPTVSSMERDAPAYPVVT
jgi:cell division protein FtsW